jgi:hypothetical protein
MAMGILPTVIGNYSGGGGGSGGSISGSFSRTEF